MNNSEFKSCPFCKESIRIEAIKCRYCGEWLEQIDKKASAVKESEIPAQLKPDLVENHVQKGETKSASGGIDTLHGKLRNFSKPLNQIGVAILVVCGVLLFLGVKGINWQHLSPIQIEGMTKVVLGLIMVLVIAFTASRSVKFKNYRVFIFSVICAVATGIGIFSFIDARQKAREANAESNRIYVSNISTLVEYCKQGGSGNLPAFQSTGDADSDALFQKIQVLLSKYFQGWRATAAEVDGLHEMAISDALLLTNQATLQAEIQKRITGRAVIDQFATNAIAMMHDFKDSYTANNVSQDSKDGFLRAFKEMGPQYEAMFAAWGNSQQSEENFLSFLDSNFTDYSITNGVVLFGNTTNASKYQDLAKHLSDAYATVQGFQKRAMENIESAKAKFQ